MRTIHNFARKVFFGSKPVSNSMMEMCFDNAIKTRVVNFPKKKIKSGKIERFGKSPIGDKSDWRQLK